MILTAFGNPTSSIRHLLTQENIDKDFDVVVKNLVDKQDEWRPEALRETAHNMFKNIEAKKMIILGSPAKTLLWIQVYPDFEPVDKDGKLVYYLPSISHESAMYKDAMFCLRAAILIRDVHHANIPAVS